MTYVLMRTVRFVSFALMTGRFDGAILHSSQYALPHVYDIYTYEGDMVTQTIRPPRSHPVLRFIANRLIMLFARFVSVFAKRRHLRRSADVKYGSIYICDHNHSRDTRVVNPTRSERLLISANARVRVKCNASRVSNRDAFCTAPPRSARARGDCLQSRAR